MVLAGARVLRLLHDHGLVLPQLRRERDRRRQARVARRPPLETLELGEQLRDVEDLALRHQLVVVHVAQAASGVARHVGPVRPGRERHPEARVPGRERLAVEVDVRGHVQPTEIHRAGHDRACLATDLAQPAGRAREVAAAGLGDHDGGGRGAIPLLHLATDLGAQGLDPADPEGGVERGVEEAGRLERHEHLVEELGSDRESLHLSAVRLAGAGLLDDLGLPDAVGVEDLLQHDAAQPPHRRLGRHGRAVVAAGGGRDARVAASPGLVAGDRCAPRLEGPGRVGRLVLEQDASALARLRDSAHGIGEVAQLVQRGATHLGLGLDLGDPLDRVARVGHHPVVVEGQRRELVGVVVDPERAAHDLDLAAHDGGIAHVAGGAAAAAGHGGHRHSSPRPMWSSSGTVVPKLCS